MIVVKILIYYRFSMRSFKINLKFKKLQKKSKKNQAFVKDLNF